MTLFAAGAPAAAATSAPKPPADAYAARLLRAVDTCEARAPQGTPLPRILSCVRDLAAPEPGNAHQDDIWRLVLDCLWFGWSPESGFDDDAVNACLGAGGIW